MQRLTIEQQLNERKERLLNEAAKKAVAAVAKAKEKSKAKKLKAKEKAKAIDVPETYKTLFGSLQRAKGSIKGTFKHEDPKFYENILITEFNLLEKFNAYINAIKKSGWKENIIALENAKAKLTELYSCPDSKIESLKNIASLDEYIQSEVIDIVWNFQYQVEHPNQKPIVIDPNSKFSLEYMPKDIWETHLLPKIGLKNGYNVLTTKSVHTLFTVGCYFDQQAATELMMAIFNCDKLLFEKMITANPKWLCVELNRSIIDLSGRKYRDTPTPLGAIFWSGNLELCEIAKKAIATLPDGYKKAYDEFDYLFLNGVSTKQKTYDFTEIIKAIASENSIDEQISQTTQNVVDTFRKNISKIDPVFIVPNIIAAMTMLKNELEQLNQAQRNFFWRQVIGGLQRFLPLCDAQKFCEVGRLGINNICYFPLDPRLGFQFAYFRGLREAHNDPHNFMHNVQVIHVLSAEKLGDMQESDLDQTLDFWVDLWKNKVKGLGDMKKWLQNPVLPTPPLRRLSTKISSAFMSFLGQAPTPTENHDVQDAKEKPFNREMQ